MTSSRNNANFKKVVQNRYLIMDEDNEDKSAVEAAYDDGDIETAIELAEQIEQLEATLES